MKNYNYNVNIYAEDEITFRTNDVRGALDTFLTHGAQGLHCDLLDGYTGEVLAIVNCPDCEDYATDEIMLMTEGVFFELLEEEVITPEAGEDEPICGECGGPVNANGVCQHCGVEDETLRAKEDDPAPQETASDMVVRMLAELESLLS